MRGERGGEGEKGKSVGVIPDKKNGTRKGFTTTNALSAYKVKRPGE
jgi:hypothetical protein